MAPVTGYHRESLDGGIRGAIGTHNRVTRAALGGGITRVWAKEACGASRAESGPRYRVLARWARLAGARTCSTYDGVEPSSSCNQYASGAIQMWRVIGADSKGWRRSRQAFDVLLVLPSSHQKPTAHGPSHSRLFCPGVAPKRPAAHSSGCLAPSPHALPLGQLEQAV